MVRKAIEAAVEMLAQEERDEARQPERGDAAALESVAGRVAGSAASGELELEPQREPEPREPVRYAEEPEPQPVQEPDWRPRQASDAAPAPGRQAEAPQAPGAQPAQTEVIWTQSNVSAETPDGETPVHESDEALTPRWQRGETPEEAYEREHRGEHAKWQDSYSAKRADALAHLAERFLAQRTAARGSVADRYQVVVHVDQRLLASAPGSGPQPDLFSTAPPRCALGDEFETERPLALETVRRLACDGSVVGIVEDEQGEPLSVGRRPGASRRRCSARSRRATAVAGILVVTGRASVTHTTSCTGPMAERRSSRI